MKTTLIVLFFAFYGTATAQPFVDVSGGLNTRLYPTVIVNVGFVTKVGEPFATASYPLMAGIGYGYPIKNTTPYFGYSTDGVFGGVRFRYYEVIAADIRCSKANFSVTIGWTFNYKIKTF